MANGTKQRPPSRIRYEENHPTVAVRLSKDLHDTLLKIKGSTGESFAQLVKRGLENIIATEEAYRKGYSEGRITELGACKRCGKPLQWDLDSEHDKALLAKAINRDGSFIHADCESKPLTTP